MNKTELMILQKIAELKQKIRQFSKIGNLFISYNNYLYVDLGLPSGNMWATMNIGASSETDAGTYFLWGSLSPVSVYRRTFYDKYKLTETSRINEGNDTFDNLVNRYNIESDDITYINSTTYKIQKYGTRLSLTDYELLLTDYELLYGSDGGVTLTIYLEPDEEKTILDLEDDAANLIMGGKWHIPSADDFNELLEYTTHVWTMDLGATFTSTINGNSIFIPCSGYKATSSIATAIHGYFAINSLFENCSYKASVVSVSNGKYYINGYGRYCGFPVRGVFNINDIDEKDLEIKVSKVAITGEFSDLLNIKEVGTEADNRIKLAYFSQTLGDGDAHIEGHPLGLLHFSDIHHLSSNEISTQDLEKWSKKYNTYIDDVICTGDVILSYLSAVKPTVYTDTSLSLEALFVLGNHDCSWHRDEDQYPGHKETRWGLFWIDCGENGNGVEVPINDNTNATELIEYFKNEDNINERAALVVNSHKYAYDTYFKDKKWIETVTLADTNNKRCYWYKDYDNLKIRLIGIDCMNRFDGILDRELNENRDFIFENGLLKIATEGFAKKTTEQETWLYETLFNTPSDYGVIIMSHFPLDDINNTPARLYNTLDNNGCNISNGAVMDYTTGKPVNFYYEDKPFENTNFILTGDFNMRNREFSSNATYGYVKGEVNNIGDIVDYWNTKKNNKFIAWICGHLHKDKFYYPTKYPNLLCVCIDKAGINRSNYHADRTADDNSNTCANYYSVDTTKGLFKIVRLGLNTNLYLTPINYLTYDYINRRVLNEG